MNNVPLILCVRVFILIQNVNVISGTFDEDSSYAVSHDAAVSHDPNQLIGDSKFLQEYGRCSLRCLRAEEGDCFQRCMRDPDEQQEETSTDSTSTEGIINPDKQRQSSNSTSTEGRLVLPRVHVCGVSSGIFTDFAPRIVRVYFERAQLETPESSCAKGKRKCKHTTLEPVPAAYLLVEKLESSTDLYKVIASAALYNETVYRDILFAMHPIGLEIFMTMTAPYTEKSLTLVIVSGDRLAVGRALDVKSQLESCRRLWARNLDILYVSTLLVLLMIKIDLYRIFPDVFHPIYGIHQKILRIIKVMHLFIWIAILLVSSYTYIEVNAIMGQERPFRMLISVFLISLGWVLLTYQAMGLMQIV